ncbi:uncharacterized protein LOC134783682 isoform X2 [Penaeus indicus]|uniref:uncharacterized protein LOC134783682 isoform X2 n=1 Tax=Penaeus indicus TaxID=29960 RepID=UPI00300C7913
MKYGIEVSPDETPPKGREEGEMRAERRQPEGEAAPRASPAQSRRPGRKPDEAADAVVFSIQFYGKAIGEVGLMDQDLSELDWKKFKSYLFQNLLSINQQDNICVSYSDEEGDKLPIESDEEYREALKVAKKKAEMHDKMVLDITRQGGLPTVLSFVSSGIKKVGSSPPKERGMSFFKASSPPKESGGFMTKDWKPFPPFFMPDKVSVPVGPIPGHVQGMWGYDCDEALECDKPHHTTTTATTTTTTTTTTAMSPPRTDCKKGPPVRSLRNSPPNLLFKFEAPSPNIKSEPPHSTTTSQAVFGAGTGGSAGGGARSKVPQEATQRPEQPPAWFITYMEKFRKEICEEVSECVMEKVSGMIKEMKFPSTSGSETEVEHQIAKGNAKLQNEAASKNPQKAKACQRARDGKNEDIKGKKKKVKAGENDVGAKRKKLAKEEERLMKKQEKMEKKKLMCKYVDEMDKASRTQEKVLAKMEGLRKKQSCSPEELNKLRKMVDKQHRVITAEQRQQRRNDRKAGNQKAGKSKKFNIDNKGFPVDASLLHAALQELEALAEDSPNEGTAGISTRGYDALYLHDVTYPDGSEVAPGTEFVKTWRVANTGVEPWNEKTTLCKWSQVRFRGSPAGWKLKPSSKKVVCPPLEPGQEGDISITFTAPSEPGWYATHWRFCQRGRVFGNQMWCAIYVADRNVREKLEPVQGEDVASAVRLMLSVTPKQCPSKASAGSEETVCDKEEEEEEDEEEEEEEEEGAKALRSSQTKGDLEGGIVENYYDAEDPFEKELRKNLKSLSLCTSVKAEGVEVRRAERDLISFEEEAEVVSSGTTTPEMIQDVPQTHAVVPLKEMAKESVESLRESMVGKDQESGKKESCRPKVFQADTLSISSGSFSELDSEDQAILNESDTEYSDNEYCLVNLPECFNVPSPYNGLAESVVQDMHDVDRPDSPDFLTADEDDRTTAVASDLQDDQAESVEGSGGSSNNSTTSQGSHLSTVVEVSQEKAQTPPQAESGKKMPMPEPPTDTKPFMEVPAEALRANLAYAVQQSSGNRNTEEGEQSKSKDDTTWSLSAQAAQSVVCEQPSSTQHKDHRPLSRCIDGKAAAIAAGGTDLPLDLVGALPDELVSIIPEDLVRGAWNTARSFITRINQEMLSPTGTDSPDQVYASEESSAPKSEPKETTQKEEPVRKEESPTERRTSPLPPPMQQLEDMGFGNREVNQRLLTKYNNDVSCAVAELIVLNCQ